MMQCSHAPFSLPPYTINAGEAKDLTFPIYNRSKRQIDMTGMTARFAIADPVNQDSAPLLIKPCSVSQQVGSDYGSLQVKLDASDTVDLCGQYIYQITIKSDEDGPGILKGLLTVFANYDKGAISM